MRRELEALATDCAWGCWRRERGNRGARRRSCEGEKRKADLAGMNVSRCCSQYTTPVLIKCTFREGFSVPRQKASFHGRCALTRTPMAPESGFTLRWGKAERALSTAGPKRALPCLSSIAPWCSRECHCATNSQSNKTREPVHRIVTHRLCVPRPVMTRSVRTLAGPRSGTRDSTACPFIDFDWWQE